MLKSSDLDLAGPADLAENAVSGLKERLGERSGRKDGGFKRERGGGFCVGPVSSSLTISSASSSSSSVSLSIPSHQSRVTSWAKESPGSWFSEFKRGKLVSFPQSLSPPLNASYILQSKLAKWPKDSPGTWYSHYKRGSLVSGPACSPGSGLDVCVPGALAWLWFCPPKTYVQHTSTLAPARV